MHKIEHRPRLLRPDAKGRYRRTVWPISTRGFPGAHFAVFPEELVSICIKAGTSEKGCCSNCGAPYTRVLESGMTSHDGKTQTGYDAKISTSGRLALLRQSAREQGEEYVNERKTIGWRPSCRCDKANPVPCVVLDSFMGSGTTAKVARDLDQSFIGFDAGSDYVDMANDRLKKAGYGELSLLDLEL